mgnify:CR=1 FL=1
MFFQETGDLGSRWPTLKSLRSRAKKGAGGTRLALEAMGAPQEEKPEFWTPGVKIPDDFGGRKCDRKSLSA